MGVWKHAEEGHPLTDKDVFYQSETCRIRQLERQNKMLLEGVANIERVASRPDSPNPTLTTVEADLVARCSLLLRLISGETTT